MKTHKYVDGLCYTLKILCPEVKELAERELGKLEGLIEKRMPLEKAHLGLKYLGYDRDYEIEERIDLVPEIKSVVDRYLPMEIRISGLGGFWNTSEWPSKPIIFLRIEENKRLRETHEELRRILKGRVDTFELAEGEHYTPHITIAVGKSEYEGELKRRIGASKFSVPSVFRMNKFGMRLKGDGLYIIRE